MTNARPADPPACTTAAIAALLLATLPLAAVAGPDDAVPAPGAAGAARVIDAVAVPADGGAMHIDGVFTEAAWSRASAVTDFVQRDPNEGAAPAHATDVRVVFDGQALYVAVRAFEPHAGELVGLLTRRDDDSPSDWVSIEIDSFYDRRTAFEFGVNAAGVKYDRYWFNDTNNDRSWDAVWDVAVTRTPDGWQAEFRVPFSQLRFRGGDASVMGFAVSRTIAHANETATWPLLAKSATGYVSSFGDLRGVERAGGQKRLELMPFVVSEVATAPVAGGDPLRHSPDPGATVGLDMKYQVAPGLTLAATVNPDFGQVEADPAVVNLGAFETFFSERRPFFVEGSGNLSFNDLFYSRRIGRAPQRSAGAPEGGFADQPANTTILGAAKLTGKIGHFAVGALHAVTTAEYARVTDGPDAPIVRTPVEPATQYSVARVSREFDDNSRLSFMVTSTRRSIGDELRFLPSSAVAGGVDGDWRFGGKYSLSGFWTGSTVRGDAEAIDRLQTSNVHSFQRTGARTLTYDPARTTLEGHAGGVNFDKIGGTRTRMEVNAGYRSPGFEINDLGFRSRADQIWQNTWFQVRDDVPSGVVRRKNVNFNQWAEWNFDGDRRSLGGNVNSHWAFTNNWEIGSGISINTTSFDDRLTRGGPGGLVPGNVNGWTYVNTDNRRLVTVNAEIDWLTNRQGSRRWDLFSGATVRPMTALSTNVSLHLATNVDATQWVTNVEALDRTHFVFGHLDQHTVSLTLRVNYTISPTLSVQIYGEPFVSAGEYSSFKELVNGRAAHEADRYAPYAYDANPDFRIRSFRTTNVLRWEYLPGSTLFVVWQQGRQDFADRGDLRLGRDFGGIFGAPAANTFLVKISRWMNF